MSRIVLALVVWLSLLASLPAAENQRIRPFVLASESSTSLEDTLATSRSALESAGFEIAGEYQPYPSARILIVTSDALKQLAAASDFGGYGAIARVALTQVGDRVQVSYTNPQWMFNVYRMSGDAGAVSTSLEKALGAGSEFGSEGGRTVENLREYHYMVFMPYFDDQVELASYGSQDEALAAVEAGLKAGKGGTREIFRVDIPGKAESLFGAAIESGEGADKAVMAVTDQAKMKHTAHLPYEMLVSNGKVYMLHGKFRIAQSFPDLTMSTFMKISGAPDAIEASLKAAAGK